MTTLFISDLHLRPDQPELIQLAVDFLIEHSPRISQLYLLGDVFNTWLGDDIVPNEFQPLIDQLVKMHQQGIRGYLMVGNRDFMMGKAFAARCHLTLLTDHAVITLANQTVLLMHGDSLCIDDVSYQRYRRWTRNRLLQWCFLALPSSYRQKISDKIKQKSREQKQFKTAMIMDVNNDEVDRIMTKYDVQYLLHGHTHRPAIHKLSEGRYRIVLGDWQMQPSYALFENDSITIYDQRSQTAASTLKLN